MILQGIDHIWAVGESFHMREHAPGDGSMLIMACWYLDVLFPLLTLGRSWLPGWVFYALALPVLVLFPVLFCRLRYTEQRRKEILARYRPRKTGWRLLGIWAGTLAVSALRGRCCCMAACGSGAGRKIRPRCRARGHPGTAAFGCSGTWSHGLTTSYGYFPLWHGCAVCWNSTFVEAATNI